MWQLNTHCACNLKKMTMGNTHSSTSFFLLLVVLHSPSTLSSNTTIQLGTPPYKFATPCHPLHMVRPRSPPPETNLLVALLCSWWRRGKESPPSPPAWFLTRLFLADSHPTIVEWGRAWISCYFPLSFSLHHSIFIIFHFFNSHDLISILISIIIWSRKSEIITSHPSPYTPFCIHTSFHILIFHSMHLTLLPRLLEDSNLKFRTILRDL